MPGVVGDATGGPVVPVNTVTVLVAAVPVVTGGTVETVDGADGSGVVTVQRQSICYNNTKSYTAITVTNAKTLRCLFSYLSKIQQILLET